MSVIPEAVIEDVRARTDIVQVIGDRVPLKRAGAAWKACCPFHNEKTPSFTVNPQRQSFKSVAVPVPCVRVETPLTSV